MPILSILAVSAPGWLVALGVPVVGVVGAAVPKLFDLISGRKAAADKRDADIRAAADQKEADKVALHEQKEGKLVEYLIDQMKSASAEYTKSQDRARSDMEDLRGRVQQCESRWAERDRQVAVLTQERDMLLKTVDGCKLEIARLQGALEEAEKSPQIIMPDQNGPADYRSDGLPEYRLGNPLLPRTTGEI